MIEVGIETDMSQYDARQASEIRTFSEVSRPALGHTQPPFQWVKEGSFSGVNRSGCEADHSPSSRLRISGAIPTLAISFYGVHSGIICTVVASRSTNTDVQELHRVYVRFPENRSGF